MFPNWWPMLTIANGFVCQPGDWLYSSTCWSSPYCQGKFYFLSNTTSGSEFITATTGVDQFATESILNCMLMASIWILKKIHFLCIFRPPSMKQFFQLCLLNTILNHALSPLGCFPCAWWYCSDCWWCGYPGFWPGSMVCISSDCLLLWERKREGNTSKYPPHSSGWAVTWLDPCLLQKKYFIKLWATVQELRLLLTAGRSTS